MIVTTTDRPSRTIEPGRTPVTWRCLARRGMLHSECEAIDHVRVPAGEEFGPPGTEGTESAWFVLGGDGTLLDGDSTDTPLSPGNLVLTPAGATARFLAGGNGLTLLWIVVLPAGVSRALPVRKPVAP